MTSHRRARITRSLAFGLAVAALSAPAAHARPMLEPGSGEGSPLPDYDPPAVTSVQRGFDWGAAAIGAGGAGALFVLISVGGSGPRPRGPSPVARERADTLDGLLVIRHRNE